MMIVMKFGGTSVGSAARIAQAAQLATASVEQGHRVVVVTSAMSGVTNTLIDAAHRASKGQWDRQVRDEIVDRRGAGNSGGRDRRHCVAAAIPGDHCVSGAREAPRHVAAHAAETNQT